MMGPVFSNIWMYSRRCCKLFFFATVDDGSCIEPEYGCIYDYSFITNYNPLATINQMSAEDNSDPCNYNFVEEV